ncbi:MAG: sugar ABC transporter substrate-binding protein [Actinomycetota bacterium]
MRKPKLLRLLALLMAFGLIAAACGDSDDDADGGDAPAAEEGGDGGEDAGGDDGGDTDTTEGGGGDVDVTLDYWLWDGNQQPFYEECAVQFTAEHGIGVNITQFGWGDYWDGLTAGFATGDVPDVFTNHLARYPEFIDAGVLVPLNDFVDRDGTATDIYFPGLADLWIAPDGSRYGLPKDFDTVALVINGDLLEAAGLTADDVSNLDWNPTDGGSFEEVVAALSVDANGVRGNEDGFDASNVATYGFSHQNIYADAFGQTGFSPFTGSNGWEFLNVNPWGDVYNYGDAEFTDTILWFRSLVEQGFMPPSDVLSGTGSDTLLGGGEVAMMPDGSWKIGTWSDPSSGVENAVFAPTPIGPSGQRASMFNGLADSITVASEHPDEAWEWVKFLASPACQEIVGAGGVVFPAISSGTDLAVEAFLGRGVDVSAFTVHVDDGTTFTFPIAGQASEVTRIMGEAIDLVIRGEGDASDIASANDQVNDLLAG